MTSEKPVSIMELAGQVSSLCSQLHDYMSSRSFPEPDFEVDGGNVPDTPEYEALRVSLNDAALDILRLVNGPKNTLQEFFFSHYDLAALQVALDRNFFNHVPLPAGDNTAASGDATATVAEIAAKAGMDEDRTERVLKMLATRRIFKQVDRERRTFAHTASSALLGRNPHFHATADMQMDDMLRAASEASATITASPFESTTTRSPFHQRYGSTMYDYYQQHPRKAQRFAEAMSGWSSLDRNIGELYDGFDWASLNDDKVVDIGGGSGHISFALARKFPSLQFVVQDISPSMFTEVPSDVSDRVTFQQYDFFEPQPVQDASVFLLRQCLHNNGDTEAIKILRAVVPALEQSKPGTALLINDIIMPESGSITRYEEHQLRQVDLCMLVTLGAKQRDEGEWRKLVKMADERFEIVKVKRSVGLGLLEVILGV